VVRGRFRKAGHIGAFWTQRIGSCYGFCVMSEDPHPPTSIVPTVPTELANVVRAGVAAGREVSGAVAMGGTVCALYAGEMLLTKAFLCYNRNYTRDFVDFAELACLLADADVVETLSKIDEKFAWQKQPSVVLGVLKTLLHAQPADIDTHGYSTLRWLAPRLGSWEQVQEKCRAIGGLLAKRVLGAEP